VKLPAKLSQVSRQNAAIRPHELTPGRVKAVVGALTKPFTGPGFPAFGAKGIILTNRPQPPATKWTNESLAACARFTNQINHFSSEIIHH